MFGKHTSSVLALAGFVALGVMLPDTGSDSRSLSLNEASSSQRRRAQTSANPPAGFEFSCPVNEEMVVVNWDGITLNPDLTTQTVTLNNGMDVVLTTSRTNDATIAEYEKVSSGILFTARVEDPTDDYVLGPDPAVPPANYPESFITLEIKMPQPLKDLYISVGDVDSTRTITDATRIRMFNGDVGAKTVVKSNSDDVVQVDNWGYNKVIGNGVPNPGYDHSLYAKADGYVDTIKLDQSVLIYNGAYTNLPQRTGKRGVLPALDFRFCAEPVPVPPAPTPGTPPAPAQCVPSKELLLETFDTNDEQWRLENGNPISRDGIDWTTHSPFMGRYATGDSSPVKTYDVGTDYDKIKVEFEFLEMDSWDSSDAYGYDTLVLSVNDERIVIGTFMGNTYDDGSRSGTSDNGVEWTCVSQGAPSQLGGSTRWLDQTHLISAIVPKALYPDGTLTLKFEVFVSQNVDDESAGYDNIRLVGLNDCPPDPTGGVNGDPLIMGLAGQLFKFDGRSGAWYSAVSAKSFQWNMKIQEYDECPADSNKFVSGVGFTLFKKTSTGRVPAHKIAINVVNEFGTSMGCGTDAINCLANGSLELTIDGKKFVYPGDYQLKDGSGRIIAFNTFYECSRKWYDFDITPADGENSALRAGRRLHTFPGVFDVVRDLEDTMIDKDGCDDWIAERQRMNDLFHQPGEWSTIIVKTDQISFHVEYKQEHKRCNAHTVDVWISSVSPDLYDQEWEGIIGETKDPANHGDEKVERSEFLKFREDESYEVISPFAYKCDGCYY